MQIGALDSYIRIERKQVTNNSDYGSEQITWVKYYEGWAKLTEVTPKAQEETTESSRLLKRPCKMVIRYITGVNATMRVVLLDRSNRIMQIVSDGSELGRKEGLEFMLEEYSV
jgi:SPP1 family predicted phage head-tail adaptor